MERKRKKEEKIFTSGVISLAEKTNNYIHEARVLDLLKLLKKTAAEMWRR